MKQAIFRMCLSLMLATLNFFSTNPSARILRGPQERLLGGPVNLQCNSSENCLQGGSVDQYYYISLELGSSFTLEIGLDDPSVETTMDFGVGIYDEIEANVVLLQATIRDYSSLLTIHTNSKKHIPIRSSVAQSSGKLSITIKNMLYSQAFVDVKVVQAAKQIWVIPVAVVAGVLISLAIIYGAARLRKRRNAELYRVIQIRMPNLRGYVPNRPGIVTVKKEDEQLTAENLDERFPEAKREDFATTLSQLACSICLEELQNDVMCRQLYCEHIFHSQCVKQWIQSQLEKKTPASCPNCKYDISRIPVKSKEVEVENKETEVQANEEPVQPVQEQIQEQEQSSPVQEQSNQVE